MLVFKLITDIYICINIISFLYTEIFDSDSIIKILHVILVTGNMINAVSKINTMLY